MTTPWNQIPKAHRERVLRNLDALAGLREDDHAAAYRAAAELLAEAAPYPDEAYAFQYGGEVMDLLDITPPDPADGEPRIMLIDQYRHVTWFHADCPSLRPLTPAARDLLDALRGAP